VSSRHRKRAAMARVKGRGEIVPQKSGRVTRRVRTKRPTKIQTDDSQSLIGLIWRVVGDSTRVVMLIVLLAAVAAIVSVVLTAVAPVWVHVSVAGTVSCGALLVGVVLHRVRRGR
jgi:hypothetical protein